MANLEIVLMVILIIVFLIFCVISYERLDYTSKEFEWCLQHYSNIETLRNRVQQVLNDNDIIVTTDCDANFDKIVFLKGSGKNYLSEESLIFINRLYSKEDIYNLISLYELYDFAEEFNTSIDFLLGRSDKEYL